MRRIFFYRQRILLFSLGCSSVIEYSRNLIWPSQFFYIKCLMLIFIWYAYKFKQCIKNGVSFNICKIMSEVLGVHKLCRHFAIPILCVSPVSQNLYGQSLNDFHIFLARKYASFRHSAYCRNHYGRLSHLRKKYIKSSENFCRFSLRDDKFSSNDFWFI